jgi:hypothetical protein
LEEDTRVPKENHRPVNDKLYHTMLYQTEILLKVALNTIPSNNLVETNLRYRTTFYDKLFFLEVHPKT